jgi:hypothetical protein
MIRTGLAICAAVVLLGAPACEGGFGGDEATPWQRLPDSPLSPREMATLYWTGDEALLVGGSVAPPCPPNADCDGAKTPPLADGAALDPQTRTWRTIATAPVPFDWATTARIGEAVYFWIPGNETRPGAPPAFLSYDLGRDRWTELPLPLGEKLEGEIVAAGNRIVAYSMTDEYGEHPDWSYDTATGAWTELPDDPLPLSYDRFMTWDEGKLVVRAHEVVPNPSGDQPTLRAAFDPDANRWRELPAETESPRSRYTVGGGSLAAEETGDALWEKLEHPPAGQTDYGQGVFASGLVTESETYYFDYAGWLFDATTNTWIDLPRLGPEEVESRDFTSDGRNLLGFNGIRWDGFDGTFVNEAWMWSPPDTPPG